MLHDASRVPSWNSNETWRPRGKVWSDIARTCLWHSMWLGGIGPCGDSNSTVRVVKALCHKLFAQSLCWFHVDSCVIPFRSFCGSWNVVECRFVRGSTSGAANQTGALQHVLVPAWQRRLSAGAGRYLWMRVAWLHTLHTLPCHKGWSDFRKTRKIMKACELWRKHTHRRIHMHGKFLNECHPQNSWQAEFFAASSCFLTLLCFSWLFFAFLRFSIPFSRLKPGKSMRLSYRTPPLWRISPRSLWPRRPRQRHRWWRSVSHQHTVPLAARLPCCAPAGGPPWWFGPSRGRRERREDESAAICWRVLSWKMDPWVQTSSLDWICQRAGPKRRRTRRPKAEKTRRAKSTKWTLC